MHVRTAWRRAAARVRLVFTQGGGRWLRQHVGGGHRGWRGMLSAGRVEAMDDTASLPSRMREVLLGAAVTAWTSSASKPSWSPWPSMP